MSVTVDFQESSELQAVLWINNDAFKTPYEANLVRSLINSDVKKISLVARQEGLVVGHLLLSEMTIKNKSCPLTLYGLAPMAVLPDYQKQGVGRALIEKALAVATNGNIDAIFVLGHPEYYPKFGFQPAADYQILSEYDVPAEVFMVFDFTHQLSQIEGEVVCYAEAFQERFKVFDVSESDYQALIELWELSVRQTHDFLLEEDIQELKPLILSHYLDAVSLKCCKSDDGELMGFVGVANQKIEMLFVSPDCQGQGVGSVLCQYAIEHLDATYVDVNEQNPKAKEFYEKVGFFKVISRSALDGQGNPYPILHMKR